ncbi:MAG: nucleotidyltransferase family protein [Cyclobacteriaceae bacterium]|nr:nucleotidyltransferase family protein [Cyclobacteriaceae bacterium]
MIQDYKKHLIRSGAPLKIALEMLNELAADAILFVVDAEFKLVGSLTDGDVRRGFLKGLAFEDDVDKFIQPNPNFLKKSSYSIGKVIEFRNRNFKVIPILDDELRVITILNFRIQKSYLPIDAIVMAGGRGERLKPMTDTVPKPLLTVGSKPIIQHNLDRLFKYGVDDIWITIRYLGQKIKEVVGTGQNQGVKIKYIEEEVPLGTIGAVRLIKDFKHPYVLVSNSDLLTNLDYEDFFVDFINQQADLSVVTIPYTVNIPYAVLETNNRYVVSFKEKPDYTYYSNGGIYLIKREVLQLIPENSFFNATDLMEVLIKQNKKVISFPLHGYWLDIGKPDDFVKAQVDIKHISF